MILKRISLLSLAVYVVSFTLFNCTYSLSHEKTLIETAPSLNKQDSVAMIQVYHKIGPWGEPWVLEDIHTWCGVTVELDSVKNEYRVVEFNYYGNFRGQIPEDFRQLTELKVLGLGGGTLSGPVPPWIGELKKLETLYIGYNQVSGSLPKEIGKLKHLKSLTLGNNRLSGELPRELGHLSDLEKLSIVDTQITGKIPRSLSKLKKLRRMDLVRNKLQGKFPVQILKPGLLVNCTGNNISELPFDIWKDNNPNLPPNLQKNQLSGEIPSWVKNTSKWKKFGFYTNNQQPGYGLH